MPIDQHKMKNVIPVQNSLAPIPKHSAHKSKYRQVSVTVLRCVPPSVASERLRGVPCLFLTTSWNG